MHGSSDVCRQWFRRVWDEGCREAIAELLAAAAPVHGLGEPIAGPAEFERFWSGMRERYNAIRVEVLDAVDEGERCYVRCCVRMESAGQPVELQGGFLAVVRGGQIQEAWNCWDFLGMMMSLGLVSEATASRALP